MAHQGSQNNRSFIYSTEDNETYFTYYSEFNRPWDGAAYVEVTAVIIIFIWSMFGNTLFLAYFIMYEKTRTITNYFVCNLALADILFVVTSPLIASVRLTGTWRLGLGTCKFFNIAALICACSMIWTMVAISIERHLCITSKTRIKRIRPKHAVLICLIMWLINCTVLIPVVSFYHIKEVNIGTTPVEICTLIWPEKYIGLLMPAGLILVIFVLPVTLISVYYYKILQTYWSAKTAIMQTSNQIRNGSMNNSRRTKDLKIVKTLVLLVVLFIVMWTPIFIVLTLIALDKNTDRRELPSAALFWTLSITYANSGVNPFLYGFTSNTLKQYVLCCCRRNKVSAMDMTYVSNTAARPTNQPVILEP